MAAGALDQTLERLRSKAAADADIAEALEFLAEDDGTNDPFASTSPEVAARVRSVNRQRLRQRGADLRNRSLTSRGVVDFIDSISDRRAVDRRRHRGTLLGIKVGPDILHPLWQFDPDRAATHPHLGQVLAALRQVTYDATSADAVMVTPRPDLGGGTIADVFSAGDAELAVRLILLAGDQS